MRLEVSSSTEMSHPVVAQMVKNLPAMQETWVQSLGWEDPLEEGTVWSFPHSSVSKESAQIQEIQVRFLGKEDPLGQEIATYSSILTWRIPWAKEPGRPQATGSQESDTT